MNKEPISIPCRYCSGKGLIAMEDCVFCNGTGTIKMEWYYGMEGKVFKLKRKVYGRYWNGHGADPEFTPHIMVKGTKVKVVMCSRFGDVGITSDLDTDFGYIARIDPEDLE